MRTPSYFQRVAGMRSGLPYLNPPRALARGGAPVDAWSEEASFGVAPAPGSTPALQHQTASPAHGFDSAPEIQDAITLATAIPVAEAAPAVVTTRNVRSTPAIPPDERIEPVESVVEAHAAPTREQAPAAVRTVRDAEEPHRESGDTAAPSPATPAPSVVPHARATTRAAHPHAEHEDEQQPLTARTTLSGPPRARRTKPSDAAETASRREPQTQTETHTEATAARSEQPSQPRSGRPSADSTRSGETVHGSNEVHIGTLEVRVLPPATNPEPVVITVPAAAPAGPLSRGFSSPVGLRQG
jgi:hypothetical protein